MPENLGGRKAKIVVTIGPSSSSREEIEGLFRAGANVFRLNLSHGSIEGHASVISEIRGVSKSLDIPVAILLDLHGPRIRTGVLKGGFVKAEAGESLSIVPEGASSGPRNSITTTYKDLPKDVKPGDRILIDDGLIELRVKGVNGEEVMTEVFYGGFIKEYKGMNLPGASISAPSLTPKDIEGVRLAVERDIDYIALSFVRKAGDVASLKALIRERGAEIPVIAKIEKAEAIERLPEILAESDGVMIARGDLGVEMGVEKVPVLQKRIISLANEADKVVITATQMLESMIKNPRPTRAEASDVANAVFDGSDALMLSGETAVGSYPVEAVSTMAKIIKEAEGAAGKRDYLLRRKDRPASSFAQAVSFAAVAAAAEVDSRAVVVFTQTGDTALMLSKLRPSTPIIAFTPLEKTARKLSLVWGVRPYVIEFGSHTDEMICRGEAALLDAGEGSWGDKVVIVSGTRVGMRGATNMMKVDWIGSDECKLYLKDKPL